MKEKHQPTKYLVGDLIHLLLELKLKGQELTDEDIRLIVGHKAFGKIKAIIDKYKSSDKVIKWLEFFRKYLENANWEIYLEAQIHDVRPDVLVINNKRRKIVIVDIKTGERNRKKYMKAVLQLCKYYRVLKELYKDYSISLYIFWAKEGTFENVNCDVKEVNRYVDKLVDRTINNDPTTEIVYDIVIVGSSGIQKVEV